MMRIDALFQRCLGLRAGAACVGAMLVASVAVQPASSSIDHDMRQLYSVFGSSDGGENGEATRRRGGRGKRVASLGGSDAFGSDVFGGGKPSLTGKGIVWAAPSSCLNSELASVVAEVSESFGRVRVSSTCRSRRHNARAGGARHSHHLSGNAVDFRVWGNVRATHAFLRSHPSLGGVKHYGGGLFHIDVGPKRRW